MSDNFSNFKNGIMLEPLSADPSNAKEGDIQFADGTARAKGLWIFQDGAWSQAGGGGGGGLDVFYSEDFETSVSASDFTTGNNATFDNGGTIDGVLSDDTTTEIAGDTSLKYTMGSSSTNDWIKSPNIPIDDKQSGNTIGLEFYYTYDGADDDIKVIVYDDTGSAVLTLATDFLKVASNPTRFSVQVPVPSTSTSLNWGFQVVTGNNTKILIADDVALSTDPFVAKDIQLTQEYKIKQATNVMTNIDSEIEYALGSATISDIGSQLLVASDDSGNTRTKFTAQRDCIVNVSFASDVTTASRSVGVGINGTVEMFGSFGDAATTNVAAGVSVPLKLNKDDFITVGVVNHAAGPAAFTGALLSSASRFAELIMVATAESDQIISYNSRNAANSMVRLHTGNGHGSSSTKIRRFSTIIDNLGSAITLAQSSTLGDTFTINEDGVYYISHTSNAGSATRFGVSLNSAQLTTDITSITSADRLGMDQTIGSGDEGNTAWAGILNKDDVIRAHDQGAAEGGGSARVAFTIAKIGVGDLLGVPKPLVGYLKDEKSTGTAGGTATSGSFVTRVLQTTSGDFSKFGTLSSNQFTLDAGTYDISANAPALQVNSHKCQLFNITTSSVELLGSVEESATGDLIMTRSMLEGRVTITVATTFELQHRVQTTRATAGFGDGAPFGDIEVYAQVKITKLN